MNNLKKDTLMVSMAVGDWHGSTNLMFYWTGFEESKMPPQPIWLDTDGHTYCKFSIGEPHNADLQASGWCEVMPATDDLPGDVKMVFSDDPDQEHWVRRIDNFGKGKDEPNAQAKWSNGESLFLWMMTDEETE